MPKVNLKDIYPIYCSDYYVEIPQDVLNAIQEMEQKEAAYRRKLFRHGAYYSLDKNDGICNEAVLTMMTPEEYYERKITYKQLYKALMSLSPKQSRRIYAHYFMNMSYAAIARTEGVRAEAVRDSVEAGIRAIAKRYKNME